MDKKITAAVLGASGLTGQQLVNILLGHPKVELRAISSNHQAGQRLGGLQQCHLDKEQSFELTYCPHEDLLANATEYQVVFACMPHGKTFDYLSRLPDNVLFIDLSADLRIENQQLYEKYYQPRAIAHNIPKTAYGLVDIYPDKIREASLIANPGCYATAIELALYPLLLSGAIDYSRDIIIDAKSGTSGAGLSADRPELLLASMERNLFAYQNIAHRHLAEVEQMLASFATSDEANASVLFVPHLLPVARGIYASCYFPITPGLLNDEHAYVKLVDQYISTYAHNQHISFCDRPPELSQVVGSNRVLFHLQPVNNVLQVFVALDNLIKGAAGQAVENMNIRFGLSQSMGLDRILV